MARCMVCCTVALHLAMVVSLYAMSADHADVYIHAYVHVYIHVYMHVYAHVCWLCHAAVVERTGESSIAM